MAESVPAPHPHPTTTAEFAANLAAVRANITAAAQRAGRAPAEVRLLPVSKTVPEDRLRLAIEAGCHRLGENKVQEAKRKSENLAELGVDALIAIGGEDTLGVATALHDLDVRAEDRAVQAVRLDVHAHRVAHQREQSVHSRLDL